MVYQVIWNRVLTPIAGTSVYSFTLILAVILAGIGAGSLVLSSSWASRFHPGRSFAVGQLCLAASAFVSIWTLAAFPSIFSNVIARAGTRSGWIFFWEFLLFSFIVLLPGLLLGALFPFAARLVGNLGHETGVEVGRVYAWNTAGSVAGALAAGFLLMRTLGSETTLVWAASGSALLGVASLRFTPGRVFRPVAGVVGMSLLVAFPFVTPSWDTYEMTSGLTQILRNVRTETEPALPSEPETPAPERASRVVFHREGANATVAVVQDRFNTYLKVNGKADASTNETDMRTQVVLGHLPFFFAPRPDDVCVIGFGSGVTSHAALTHPLKRLDNIEIEPAVIEASGFFSEVSSRPLQDPRSQLILEDARTVLLYSDQSYDIVISEPSNPWMAGLNNLFTSEFYRAVRERLNPGGVFCQWIQAYELSTESFQILIDTLSASFPYTQLFAANLGNDMILLASEHPLALVPGAAELFPDRPRVAADLARVGVRHIADLAILYTRPVAPPAPGRLLNTDDNSIVQYRAPLDLLERSEDKPLPFSISGPDLYQLFFSGRDQATAFVELGYAAYRRGAVNGLGGIVQILETNGYPAQAEELKGLLDRLQEQDQRR